MRLGGVQPVDLGGYRPAQQINLSKSSPFTVINLLDHGRDNTYYGTVGQREHRRARR
jgi:hypothetical protein